MADTPSGFEGSDSPFEKLGHKLSITLDRNRFLAVMVFGAVCLVVGFAFSSTAAQAIANSVAVVLAAWAILVITRGDDAGFQTVEQQKKFLVSYATRLSLIYRQLSRVYDRSISREEFRPHLIALESYDGIELAGLLALARHGDEHQTTGRDLFDDHLAVCGMLRGILQDEKAAALSLYAEAPDSEKLERVLLRRLQRMLNDMQRIDEPRLRTVYERMSHTSQFLDLVEAALPDATAAEDIGLDHLPTLVPELEAAVTDDLKSLCNMKGYRGVRQFVPELVWLYRTHSAALSVIEAHEGGADAVESMLDQRLNYRGNFKVTEPIEFHIDRDPVDSLASMMWLSQYATGHSGGPMKSGMPVQHTDEPVLPSDGSETNPYLYTPNDPRIEQLKEDIRSQARLQKGDDDDEQSRFDELFSRAMDAAARQHELASLADRVSQARRDSDIAPMSDRDIMASLG